MKTVDYRALACPIPVVMTKKELETNQPLRVLLDDGAPRENVSRFATNRGYTVSEERDGSCWALTITSSSAITTQPSGQPPEKGAFFLVTSDCLGNGPEELGQLLMKNFINTLIECDPLPEGIYFMNSGVKLCCENSDSLEALNKLELLGVEIRSCGLCLDYFDLKEQLRSGSTTNMLTTIENLLTAPKVVRL